MGYRSILICQVSSGDLPDWYKDKYKDRIDFNEHLMVSKFSFKIYTNELFNDLHKALKEFGYWKKRSLDLLVTVIAEEDDIITSVFISKKSIRYLIMKEDYEWHSVYNQGF